MKKLLSSVLLSAALFGGSAQALANEIGITPQATYQLTQQPENKVLFIDVRDPVEIMFIGFSDAVDQNIPYLMVDRNEWQEEQQRFRMERNPDFVSQVEAALAAKGLDKDATIITMCRSGSERGLPSAEFLREHGFKNARYVVDGFQGSSIKEGEQKGFRTQNGWQNSNLPWQSKANSDKIYRSGK
ncbi:MULTISPECIES: rhodanese-like domain-containing protein [Oceanisphaera]|uniref:Rhodanese-like domain-containing protein n=1 Tax=Oceanisphaera ostreae TaxID=914151 RepID=A0ABW3KH02_9GAMM